MTIQPVTSANASPISQFSYVCDASSLMLPPGRWPFELKTNLGNGCPFIGIARHRNGDYVRYRQANGCIELKVFNT